MPRGPSRAATAPGRSSPSGVDRSRIGERVWVSLAQSYRPSGTAAEYTVVPAYHAVPLQASVPDEQAAEIGIPGITGHRAIFASGPVTGQRVVVTGALGAVGRAAVAVAVARRGGATAATDLTAALVAGGLRYPIAARLPLAEIAQAHELARTQRGPGPGRPDHRRVSGDPDGERLRWWLTTQRITREKLMSDEENTPTDETPDEAAEETPTFANRAERRAKGKTKGSQHHQHGSGGFTGKGGTFQPPRNYGSRRSG